MRDFPDLAVAMRRPAMTTTMKATTTAKTVAATRCCAIQPKFDPNVPEGREAPAGGAGDDLFADAGLSGGVGGAVMLAFGSVEPAVATSRASGTASSWMVRV